MRNVLRTSLARVVRHGLSLSSRPLAVTPAATLIVAPHADDEVLGCGGLIAAKAQLRAPVHVVFVTDSGAAGWGASESRVDRVALRQREALASLATLGVDTPSVTFLEAPDGELDRLTVEMHGRIVVHLAALLKSVRPAEMFLPLLGEGSTEHDAVVWLAREAVAIAGIAPNTWEYPVWAWWNALRLRRQLLRAGENFRFDAAPWWDAKCRALACHASQLPHLPRALCDAVEAPFEFYFRRPPRCL